MRLLERGWLSSNNILFLEGPRATLVDSGYVSHAAQTVALLRASLDGRTLSRLVNTHSHSDHIGGNASVQRAFDCRITIPAGMAEMIERWDEAALMLAETDQLAERFAYDELIAAGDEIEMGGMVWQAIAAPGHDMNALIYYNAAQRLLISGDALWQHGFGLVFAALLGDETGLPSTRATLKRIGALAVDVVIPGHGPAFGDFDGAMSRAFARLASFEADSDRLARHAAKVIFSFALLDKRRLARDDVAEYLSRTALFGRLNARYFRLSWDALADWLVDDLLRAGAVRLEDGVVLAAG